MKRAALILSLLLLPELTTQDARGQTAASPPKPSKPPVAAPELSERIDVRAIDVEVVVTDAKGRRVEGLTVKDFRLLVDGREERIDDFAEVKEGTAEPASPASPASSPASAASGSPSPPSTAASGRDGTGYLVFIDDAFAIASQRNAALATVQRDLALLGPNDRMAIVAYDGRRLTVLSRWTGDRTALKNAFGEATRRKTYGSGIVADRRGNGRAAAIDERDLYEDTDLLTVNPVGGTWELERHASGAGKAASAAADALRGMPLPRARRVMMVLAGGWPWDGDPKSLQPLTNTANLLGYTLYPVYVAGFDPLVEAIDTEVPEASMGVDSRGMYASPIVTGWQRRSEAALQSLAKATGGVAALNRDHALRQVITDLRSYYRVGFSPIWKPGDRPHVLHLDVRRPGLTARVRSRGGPVPG